MGAADGDRPLSVGAGQRYPAGVEGDDARKARRGTTYLEAASGDDYLQNGDRGSDTYRSLFFGSGHDPLYFDFDVTGDSGPVNWRGRGARGHYGHRRKAPIWCWRITATGDRLAIRTHRPGRLRRGARRVRKTEHRVGRAQLSALSTTAAARERADVIFGTGGNDGSFRAGHRRLLHHWTAGPVTTCERGHWPGDLLKVVRARSLFGVVDAGFRQRHHRRFRASTRVGFSASISAADVSIIARFHSRPLSSMDRTAASFSLWWIGFENGAGGTVAFLRRRAVESCNL